MKNPIILQYKNPESLVDGTLYYGGLVITAMQQMKAAYQTRKVKAHVEDANTVLRILLPDWYDPFLGLKQFCILSDTISRLAAQYSNPPEASAFLNNCSEILRSIKQLAEIGVDPESMPDNTIEAQWLKILYQNMLQNKDSGLRAFQRNVEGWNSVETFKRCLQTCQMKKTGQVIGVPKAVYFQGFYYITPLQLRLIRAFCQLDIPVYFLNAMDEACSSDYAVWMRNPFFQPITKRRALEKEAPLPEGDFKIRKFNDTFSMVCRFRSLNLQEYAVYAPMSTDIKIILETFFPEQDEKTHIFAYPIGRYLLSLYNLWDDDQDDFRLDSSEVRRALATGWAGPLYEDSTHLLMVYDKIRDYFQDCMSFADWQSRLETLQTVVHEIMPCFKEPAGMPERKRWRRVFSQPFRVIGAFDCTDEEIQSVTQAVRQIMADAEFLFGGGASVDLKSHFSAIEALLQKKTDSQKIHKEEQRVLAHLKERLSWSQADDQPWPIKHLTTAMRLFLGGNLDSQALDSNPDEGQAGGVRGISDIESALILHKDKKILLCCCDADNFPGRAKPYPWPLTSPMLETIINNQGEHSEVKGRCEAYIHAMETTQLGNRYLFHLARHIPGIEFSWIEHQGNKVVNASIYLAELAKKYEVPIEAEKGLLVTPGHETLVQSKPWNLADSLTGPEPDGDGNIPQEWHFDKIFCPGGRWRWLYNYVLQDHPAFTDRFQLSFLMTALIAVTADAMPCKKKKAAAAVFSIYPAFSSSERQERLDFVGQTRQMGRAPYDGSEYNLKRLYG